MQRFAHILLAAIIVASVLATTSSAAPPPRRTEVSLDGTWTFIPDGGAKTTIRVPFFWDQNQRFREVSRAVYERSVTVPADWRDRVVTLEFMGINQIADIYVDGGHVAHNIGGWNPIVVDITSHVTPGEPFLLRVEVKGGDNEPFSDASGKPLWPAGHNGNTRRFGIAFPVLLRAYGPVHVRDAFIRPSVRNGTLSVDYEVRNTTDTERTIRIEGVIAPWQGGDTVKTIASEPVTLAPGESRTVTVSAEWPDAHLWTPDDPYLYLLTSTVREGKKELDRETRRFGFREFWIRGNAYMLNDHRVNMVGDNFWQHCWNDSWKLNPATMKEIIRRLKFLNANVIRVHMEPGPEFLLDVADEEGFLVIWETAVCGRGYMIGADMPVYLANTRTWLEGYVKKVRNHPSLVMWSADNEMGKNFHKVMTDSEILALGTRIKEFDPTRPVIYDGELDVRGETITLHYPETYKNRVSGNIYNWYMYVSKDKPTGIGEYLGGRYPNPEVKHWWQGTWTRGLRYVNFADLRFWTIGWAWNRGETDFEFGMTQEKPRVLDLAPGWDRDVMADPIRVNLRNSFARVALFDKDYDNLGVEPFTIHKLPALAAGREAARTLILYNDEHEGEVIDITMTVGSGKTVYGAAAGRVTLARGEHVDIPVTFIVPNTGGKPLDMVLETRKGGVRKFSEIKRFNVEGSGGAKGRIAITIGAPRQSSDGPY